jgi:peptidoglycan-associated lipoprotein
MNIRFISAVIVAVALAACASPKKEATTTSTAATPPAATMPRTGPAPDSAEYFNTVVGNTVNYDFDKFELRADSQAILRGQAAWLNQNPSRTVTVEGHCDERGTREYNLGLGERRANSAKQYLTSLGVAASRVKTISYGKERPTCVAADEACAAKNRRGVSVVQ